MIINYFSECSQFNINIQLESTNQEKKAFAPKVKSSSWTDTLRCSLGQVRNLLEEGFIARRDKSQTVWQQLKEKQ